jgi:hypothetical protein
VVTTREKDAHIGSETTIASLQPIASKPGTALTITGSGLDNPALNVTSDSQYLTLQAISGSKAELHVPDVALPGKVQYAFNDGDKNIALADVVILSLPDDYPVLATEPANVCSVNDQR